LATATGIGICAGIENPFKDEGLSLLIIDIDKPQKALEKYPILKELLEKTVAWKSGLRCKDILCEGKLEKQDGVWVCKTCGKEYSEEQIKDLPRGIGFFLLAPAELVKERLGGTKRKLKDVEILVNNYALIPPSLHPSGIRYEWIREFNFKDPHFGIYVLSEEEFNELIEQLFKKEEQTREPLLSVEKRFTPHIGKRLRELGDKEIEELARVLEKIYKEGFRQDIWLFFSGWCAHAGISPVSVAKVLKKVYDETGDKDNLKTRGAAIVYTYKKLGIDLKPYEPEFIKIFGDMPYGFDKELEKKKSKGKEAYMK
jgi:Bifunctional DNA primase/polymerase, N-terminal.